MKNLIFLIIVVFVSSSFMDCKSLESLNSKIKSCKQKNCKTIHENLKIPIKIKIGTTYHEDYFDRCKGSNQIYPCPGINVDWKPELLHTETSFLSKKEIESGFRIVKIKLVEGDKLKIFFQDDDYDNGGNQHVIANDIDLGNRISEALNLKTIIIQKGIYQLNYVCEKYSFSIVDVEFKSCDKSNIK